ncbi:MAG: biotin synthase BioB [Planctomycetota bacterium]|nr:biotin synthase BioB [Planctomycetota bacterium]MCX8040684.1 biotin synthase BioB [Planctomycetota bacterium]MDW8373871.1 biotin synthase BioB [Planctomycetota bacterium]
MICASPAISSDPAAIAALAARIIDGGAATPEELRALLDVAPNTPAAEALFAGAQRIREHFHGNRLKACSVINVKAGNCSEDCGFCAQSADSTNDGYRRTKWLPDEEILRAAQSSAEHGAEAVSLVAAWRGVKEGPQLAMVTEAIRRFAANGRVRPDVNLGILESQRCADEIAKAGARVYGHNLETAASYFQRICSTHSWEERMRTIHYIKRAGMGLCCGGIFGMGESKEQRVEFLQQIAFVAPDMVPLNFLNPLPGTRFAHIPKLDPDEALITLAVARFALPDRNLMAAGGKEAVLGERVTEIFKTGINCIMVGNYLTTCGADPALWRAAAARYGLRYPGDEL